jgi:Ca2+-binding RTX toxin-like protein
VATYTGFQFQPGTVVYYSFAVHSYWDSLYGDYIDAITQSTYQNYTISALQTWSSKLNISFVYSSSAQNADLTINWASIDGRGNTLGLQTQYDPNNNGIVSGPNEGLSAIFMDIYDYTDFYGVIKHEIGHALGLGHYGNTRTLMYPYYSGQTITQSDIADAAELYGYNYTGTVYADSFSGSSKADIFSGSWGNDRIYGEAGNDILYGNQGIDSIIGGGGNDTIYAGQNSGALTGTPLAYRDGVEYVWGGDGNDMIYGNHGTDVLMGQNGNDTIYGGQDGDGIQGGYGDDRLFGNLGADKFYYNFFNEGFEGNDTIEDYSASQGDALHLTNSSVLSTQIVDSGIVLTLTHGTTISLIGIYDYSSIYFIT